MRSPLLRPNWESSRRDTPTNIPGCFALNLNLEWEMNRRCETP
jgi:hypothetical protein